MEKALWNIQKLIFMPVAVIAAALLPLAISLSRAAEPASPGERLFKSKCSICHATDGSGNTPKGKKEKVRDLRSAEVQHETDAALIDIVTNGKTEGKRKMEAYKDRLTPEQIKELVAYVRVLGKKK